MLEDYIKNLIKILENSNIDEMEVSTFWGKQKIRVRKKTTASTVNDIEIINDKSVEPSVDNNVLSQNIKEENEVDMIESDSKHSADSKSDDTIIIKSPLVGTFYCSPKPNDPPFISEGDVIREGQIICIIEAMKIFNEIESEVSGRIEKILIKDSTPIEYDQDLIIISPE
tara:strand:+ start:325 stop:834 length:510 start_codon:yes stop_codon:yes gene_type:complete